MPKYRELANGCSRKSQTGPMDREISFLPSRNCGNSLTYAGRLFGALWLCWREEGLIYGRQGSGSFVRDPAEEEAGKSRRIAVVTTYVDNYIFPRLFRELSRYFGSGFSGADFLYQ